MAKRPVLTLPGRIETPRDIVRFFLYLDRVDQTSFHPDDRFWSPEGGVQYVNRDGTPAYTAREAKLRDRLMRQAWRVVQQGAFDIYEVALSVTNPDRAGSGWIRDAMNEMLSPRSRKYWDPAQDA